MIYSVPMELASALVHSSVTLPAKNELHPWADTSYSPDLTMLYTTNKTLLPVFFSLVAQRY